MIGLRGSREESVFSEGGGKNNYLPKFSAQAGCPWDMFGYHGDIEKGVLESRGCVRSVVSWTR